MKIIGLTQGQYAIIDDEDLNKIKMFTWCAANWSKTCAKYNKMWYAITAVDGIQFMLHRVIVNCYEDSLVVDHINGNTLDCRKINLRIATPMQNAQNKRNYKGGNYKGVHTRTYKSGKSVYISQIASSGITLTKQFTNECDAAQWYNDRAFELHGEFARLNIVDKSLLTKQKEIEPEYTGDYLFYAI